MMIKVGKLYSAFLPPPSENAESANMKHSRIVDASIKHQISGQSTTVIKGCRGKWGNAGPLSSRPTQCNTKQDYV